MFKSLAILTLACAPLLANAADLAGVWTGTLGKSAITACFNGAHGANGSYYYQRILTPIQLTQANASEPWAEEGQTGLWQLDEPQGDTLTGTWSKTLGGKSLALMLKRADTDGCASDAYNNALEAVPPAVTVERKTFAEHAYQVKTQGGQVILKLEGDGAAIDKINRELARSYYQPGRPGRFLQGAAQLTGPKRRHHHQRDHGGTVLLVISMDHRAVLSLVGGLRARGHQLGPAQLEPANR